jgi:MFS transporter, DHA1 family, multidrug resistance protein
VGSRPSGSFLERIAFRQWRAITGLFLVSTLLESLAIGHLTAFTPLFLRDELHLPQSDVAAWTGLLTAATFAVAFPLAPLWGSLAERYSRKLVIVRSQYVEAVAYVMCAFSPDLAWLLAARLLLGLTFGNIAIVIASQTLLTPERRMATAIAIVQAANPIALSIGPPLGAAILPHVGIRGLFVADGVGCLLAALLVTLFMPEPPGRNRRARVLASMRGSVEVVWRRPVLRWNFVSWYLTRGSVGVLDTYLPVRIGELVPDPAPVIGGVLGVYGALTTVATWVTGRVVDRVGAARLFWPAMVIAAGAAVLTALSPVVWLLALATWARSIPTALTGTVLYAHLGQVLRREERAPIMSLTPVPRNVAQFSLPLIAAAAATLGTSGALLVGAVGYGMAAAVGRMLAMETERVLASDSEKAAEESKASATA